jgi:hypothetical protein
LNGGFVYIYNATDILIINKRGILKMRKKILNLKAFSAKINKSKNQKKASNGEAASKAISHKDQLSPGLKSCQGTHA